MPQTHRYKIASCECGAELCCQTNGADYEGPSYWVGGDYECQHVVEGCEFEDIRYPEEVRADHINRQLYHKFPELRPNDLSLDAVCRAAGFIRGIL